MSRMGTRNAKDLIIARLAAAQHGVVSRRQLLAEGLTTKEIATRVRARRLVPRHPGVYAVGHPVLTREGRWMAAVLYVGDAGCLSHRAAAALWDLDGWAGGVIDVTTRARGGRRVPAPIRVHRFPTLSEDEVTVEDGICATTPMRTLLDLAPGLSDRRLEALVARADRVRRFDLTELRGILRRHARRPGAPRLAALLDRLDGVGPARTRSPGEVALLELCDDFGLPAPMTNVPILGVEVDAHWPGTTLIVEVDGYEFHRTPTAFEADRDRDQLHAMAGFTTARFTKHQLERSRAAESARRLRLLIERCSTHGVP